ncbi:MAG TPA: hypothetical protein VD905_02205 [Flavobacteriales bacterium]|nr:hypothetical protein [Flavobacteriales bacterium]
MSKIHIGKKIREVLDKSPMTMVDFAKKINLTRDGAYKMMEKETIATDQLQKISTVLNHDFFAYYQTKLNIASEKNTQYGYATKEEVGEIRRELENVTKILHRIMANMEQPVVKQRKKKK